MIFSFEISEKKETDPIFSQNQKPDHQESNQRENKTKQRHQIPKHPNQNSPNF